MRCKIRRKILRIHLRFVIVCHSNWKKYSFRVLEREEKRREITQRESYSVLSLRTLFVPWFAFIYSPMSTRVHAARVTEYAKRALADYWINTKIRARLIVVTLTTTTTTMIIATIARSGRARPSFADNVIARRHVLVSARTRKGNAWQRQKLSSRNVKKWDDESNIHSPSRNITLS